MGANAARACYPQRRWKGDAICYGHCTPSRCASGFDADRGDRFALSSLTNIAVERWMMSEEFNRETQRLIAQQPCNLCDGGGVVLHGDQRGKACPLCAIASANPIYFAMVNEAMTVTRIVASPIVPIDFRSADEPIQLEIPYASFGSPPVSAGWRLRAGYFEQVDEHGFVLQSVKEGRSIADFAKRGA